MKILYAAPVAKRYRAIESETRRAAEDGHEVHLAAARRPYWDDHPLDARVTAHWLHPAGRRAPESALATALLYRLPRGLLRRLGRGPLAGPAAGALRVWNRRVTGPLDRRRKRRTAEVHFAYRRSAVLDLIAEHRYDWIVLSEPGAIDLLADDLPGLLDRRPGLRTTYTYEAFAEARDAR